MKNKTAQQTYSAKLALLDTQIAELMAMRDAMKAAPASNWADVGDAEFITASLAEPLDRYFKRGEYA